MNMHVHPAHVASLALILREVAVSPAALAEPEAPPAIVLLCAAIGRTAADVAALLFVQPVPIAIRDLFEGEIRQAVAAELLTRPELGERERMHLEDIAWIAFDRRMERHERHRALAGVA
ncbi:hypothetical protein ACLNGM_20200 [Aureimonas phyllosphaerae]|uniref:hypothetical protein n=1 Tax=Aureimonas phyllosphaerae TaxID=1166078 RepID=UPI003A5C71CC